MISAIWLLSHWQDVTNKASFTLKQMPPTKLSELQKDWTSGLTEQELTAKAFIDNVHVNEFVYLSVYVPRIIDLNSVSLVTSGEVQTEICFVRMNAQGRIIEKLVNLTYTGGLINHGVDGRMLGWEMQMRMKRLRVGLAKQTLLCDQDATLNNIKKDLSLEIHGKMRTNLLYTNLDWNFNSEHRVKDMFDGDFKLISRFGYLMPAQQEQPVNLNIPICLDLEASGRQWKVDEQAIDEMRIETTPGLSTMLIKLEGEVDFKIKKLQDGLDDIKNASNTHMFSINNSLDGCLIALGAVPVPRLPQDGSLCDETSRLDLEAGEVNVPMDTGDDTVSKNKNKNSRKK